MSFLVAACGLNDSVEVLVQIEQDGATEFRSTKDVLEKKAQQFVDALLDRDKNSIISILSPDLLGRIEEFGGIDLFVERELAKLESSLEDLSAVGTHVQLLNVDVEKSSGFVSLEVSIGGAMIPKRWFMTHDGDEYLFVFQRPGSSLVATENSDFATFVGAAAESNYVVWNYRTLAVIGGRCGTNSHGNGGMDFTAYGNDPNTPGDFRSTTIRNCENSCPTWFDGSYFYLPIGHSSNRTQACDWNSYGPDLKVYADNTWYCHDIC